MEHLLEFVDVSDQRLHFACFRQSQLDHDDQLGFQLRQRTETDRNKLREFGTAPSSLSFGDVGRNGDRRSSELGDQTKLFLRRKRPRQRVDQLREINALLLHQ